MTLGYRVSARQIEVGRHARALITFDEAGRTRSVTFSNFDDVPVKVWFETDTGNVVGEVRVDAGAMYHLDLDQPLVQIRYQPDPRSIVIDPPETGVFDDDDEDR